MSFRDNLKILRGIGGIEKIVLYRGEACLSEIPNAEGKRGSLQVYANLLGFRDGVIDVTSARRGLGIFDEYVQDARTHPGTHPNIDVLLEIVQTGEPVRATIHYTFYKTPKQSP